MRGEGERGMARDVRGRWRGEGEWLEGRCEREEERERG